MVIEVIEVGSSAGRVGSGGTLTCGDEVLSLDGANLTCLKVPTVRLCGMYTRKRDGIPVYPTSLPSSALGSSLLPAPRFSSGMCT